MSIFDLVSAIFREDQLHASGDPGQAVLGVRRDAGTSPVSTDGDYHNLLFDSTGNLKVSAAGAAAAAVTISGGQAADGAAVSGNPVRIGGKDGSGNTQDIITDTSGNLQVVGPAADDAAAVGNPLRCGGVYSSSLPTLTDGDVADILLDSSSRPLVALGQRLDSENDAVNIMGIIDTYEAAFAVVGAASGDVVEIIGSATTIIRILEIDIFEPSTQRLFSLIKRSTAATGGTSANATLVPLDSANAAATAVIKNYSADPTEGAAVGTILRKTMGTSQTIQLNYVDGGGQPVVLRGVAQTLCINVDGATNFDVRIRFTEQTSL